MTGKKEGGLLLLFHLHGTEAHARWASPVESTRRERRELTGWGRLSCPPSSSSSIFFFFPIPLFAAANVGGGGRRGLERWERRSGHRPGTAEGRRKGTAKATARDRWEHWGGGVLSSGFYSRGGWSRESRGVTPAGSTASVGSRGGFNVAEGTRGDSMALVTGNSAGSDGPESWTGRWRHMAAWRW